MTGREAGGIPPCTCAVTIHEGCFAYEPEVPDGAELRIEYCEQHERLEAKPRYCLVSDDDGHAFVVPEERRDEFFRITEAIAAYWRSTDEDAYCPTMPDEFYAIEGSLTFERPEADGRAI